LVAYSRKTVSGERITTEIRFTIVALDSLTPGAREGPEGWVEHGSPIALALSVGTTPLLSPGPVADRECVVVQTATAGGGASAPGGR